MTDARGLENTIGSCVTSTSDLFVRKWDVDYMRMADFVKF